MSDPACACWSLAACARVFNWGITTGLITGADDLTCDSHCQLATSSVSHLSNSSAVANVRVDPLREVVNLILLSILPRAFFLESRCGVWEDLNGVMIYLIWSVTA
jgi:hypothetical protein